MEVGASLGSTCSPVARSSVPGVVRWRQVRRNRGLPRRRSAGDRELHEEERSGGDFAAQDALADLPQLAVIERGARVALFERRQMDCAVAKIIIRYVGFCVKALADGS